MKATKLLFIVLFVMFFMGCSPEKDINSPDLIQYVFYEDFLKNSQDGFDINLDGWTNFTQTGTVKWKQGIYSGTKYAEFTGYKSGEDSNISWLISPSISMDNFNHETLVFDLAQAYVSSPGNSIELLISTNFDGNNVLAATWETKDFTKPILAFETNYIFFSSGSIDLSKYEKDIYIAFKVIGSGTNTNLDGTYEIDNIRVFNKQ